jgi:hypothetical protein
MTGTVAVVASQAFYIGAALLAVSIGFVMYQLYKNKLNTP